MSNLVILYENFGDFATLSGGSWLSALPLTNMQDPDIHKVARSSNATIAATEFKLDLGTEKPVDGVAFGPCNLSPGATWRLKSFSDSSYSETSPSALFYDSGDQFVIGAVINWANPNDWLEWEDPGFWLGISDFQSLDELPQFNYHIVPENQGTARFWKLQIFDEANADGYVEIGRFVIARAFRPTYNYSEDNQFSAEPITDMNEALGGLRTYWDRGIRRTFRCSFPELSLTEGFSDVIAMSLHAGISRQIFLVPDPADVSFYTRRAFLATMRSVPTLQQLLMDRSTTSIDLEEVL